MTNNIKTSAILACAFALSAHVPNVFAQGADKSGYLLDQRGEVVKTPFNLCVRASWWSPAMAIAECDPDLVKKAPPPPAARPTPPAPAPRAEPPTAQPKPAPSPVTEKFTLSADTHFDFDKAVLKPEGKSTLDNLVAKLKGVNLEVIIAVGHTDSVGSKAYNLKLSLRRANAVKSYLVGKGISGNRIYTEGKGKAQPIASNKTKQGRAKNRRVEIEVVGTRSAAK